MIATHRSLRWLAITLGLLLSAACATAHARVGVEGPATLELRRLVAANPEVRRLLVTSTEQAKQINSDRHTNPAQSLEEYFEFISWAERAMPGSLIEHGPNATLYQRIDQSLGYLYFICDQPLEELKGRGYFNNSLQYVEPYGTWLRSFVRSWGAFLDSPASWNEEHLRLASAADGSIVASPVDAIPQGVWPIDNRSQVIAKPGVAVKTGTVQSVDSLLGAQTRYQGAFAGGTFTHLFLDVGDYHWYHFPLGGVVKEIAVIPGQEISGGYITWDSRNRRYAFDPSSIGWQSLETRGCVILETAEFGLVALLPIGMSPVSSVAFEPALKPGVQVRKGDVLGHFLFGGSDFVMLFQAGYAFTLEPPQADSHHLLMGEQLGRLRRVSAAK